MADPIVDAATAVSAAIDSQLAAKTALTDAATKQAAAAQAFASAQTATATAQANLKKAIDAKIAGPTTPASPAVATPSIAPNA
jgi:hypothetical protein